MNNTAPSTPSRKRRSSSGDPVTPLLVTPSRHHDETTDEAEQRTNDDAKACRQLSMPAIEERDDPISPAKRSYFGRNTSSENAAQPNTRQVYALVNKMTGSIGGNGKRSFLKTYFHINSNSNSKTFVAFSLHFQLPQVTEERFMVSSLLDPCRRWWN
jgi:hypothetical protein